MGNQVLLRLGLVALIPLVGCMQPAHWDPQTASTPTAASVTAPSTPAATPSGVAENSGATQAGPDDSSATPRPDVAMSPFGSAGRGGMPDTMPTEMPVATPPLDDDWSYHEVAGAICRDGSPAGYYLRRGDDDKLLIFLNGGGACYDDFFCSINPANVNESSTGDTLTGATLNQLGGLLMPVRQQPPDDGIFARDNRNPVANFSMVFVPYCTGDVHAGTTPNSPVFSSQTLPPQQFVGYTNLGLIYRDLDPALLHPSQVMLAGTSAGSFGTLINFQRTSEFFAQSRVFALADSGLPFRDAYLEPCLQKRWRQLFGLDKVLPKDCKECFHDDGGGLAEGLGNYLFKQRYPGRIFGGLVTSTQDQIMKLLFSAGLEQCQIDTSSEALAIAVGLGSYPKNRYPSGIADVIDNVLVREQSATYLIDSSRHQHIFRARYYEDNGVGMSIADWVAAWLAGDVRHLGTAQ